MTTIADATLAIRNHQKDFASWTPGDHPSKHPMWQDQADLEFRMMDRGAADYLAKVSKYRDKGRMSETKPYRRVMEMMVTAMGTGLRAWVANTKESIRLKGHAPPISLAGLSSGDPLVLSYVTVRTVLDGMAGGHLAAMTVARQIGLAIEQEAKMRAWLKGAPELFETIQRGLKEQRATAQHRRRVNINRFNTLMQEPLQWHDWSSTERLHIGLKLLDILCRTTGHFEVAPDPAGRANRKQGKGRFKSPALSLSPSDALIQYLKEQLDADAKHHPRYLPTLMPPKRWEGISRGGYYTPVMTIPKLIRFKADNEESRGAALAEFDSFDMPRVYEAINRVQEVPWLINRKILNIAWHVWENNLKLGGVERYKQELQLPPAPTGMRRPDLKGRHRKAAEHEWGLAHAEELKTWKRAAAEAYGKHARVEAHGLASKATLDIANEFAKQTFYFPHMLDFRGRMYPVPLYLHPQGGDLARGLLTFAEGRPITEKNNGAGWLAVHLAGVWGNDKVSYDERIKWVDEREDLWRRIAADPLRNTEWTTADHPWQALAAVAEWARFLETGFGFVSSLPVRVDGTCNGIQHLSAMMRDEVAAESVNLMPADAPRDIYDEVALILQRKLEEILEAGGQPAVWAAAWLKACGGRVSRKLTKNPVMVLPYGGTKDSYFGSVHEWLRDNDPDGLAIAKDDRKVAVPWLVTFLWDAVSGVVVQGRHCMEWLKACADCVVEANQPIYWTTPTGFHVRHFYGQPRTKRIRTLIDGKNMSLVDYTRTKNLSRKEQLQGISPNFVHSMDGSVNMETILRFMVGKDKVPFTTIHDAFGTVAGQVTRLQKEIREAFIDVHTHDVLDDFRQRCVVMLGDYIAATHADGPVPRELAWEMANDRVPRLPERGNLNLALVRDAEYFFA